MVAANGNWKNFGNDDWMIHPRLTDAPNGRTVEITVPTSITGTALQTALGGVGMQPLMEQAVKDGLKAVLEFFGKEASDERVEEILKGLGAMIAPGPLAWQDRDAVDYSAPTYHPSGRIEERSFGPKYQGFHNGRLIDFDTVGAPGDPTKIIFLVHFSQVDNTGFNEIFEGGDIIPKTYDWFSDPRVREVGCLEASSFIGSYTKLKGALLKYQRQIDSFKSSGGILDLDMTEEVRTMDEFLKVLDSVTQLPGQSYNVAGDNEAGTLLGWSFFGHMIGKPEDTPTNAKLYIGVGYDYKPLFMTLEVDQPSDIATDSKGKQVFVTPLIGLDLMHSQLVSAGRFVSVRSDAMSGIPPSPTDINTARKVRINTMMGIEKLGSYVRSVGFLLRMDKIIKDSSTPAADTPQFLVKLPQYVIDFPTPDQEHVGQIEEEVAEDEETIIEDAAWERRERELGYGSKQITETSETTEGFSTLLQGVSGGMEYYYKLLQVLNIQSLMRTVMECYVGETDFVDQMNAWCKTIVKMALDTAFEPATGVYIHEVIASEDLTIDEQNEAMNSLIGIFGEPAKAILDGVTAALGVVSSIGDVSAEQTEPPISMMAVDFGADPNVAVPTLGSARDTVAYGGEAQELASNADKLERFMIDIEKYLDLSDVCDKLSSSIPSLPNLLSGQAFGGRPGDIGAMEGLIDPDYWADRFEFPLPPQMSFSQDFSFGDLLGFVANQIHVTLERTLLSSIQNIFSGLMQDWLDACRDGDSGLNDEDVAAHEQLGEDAPPPMGTIMAGLGAPAMSGEDAWEMFLALVKGLTKLELCGLLSGKPNIAVLDLMEVRVKANYTDLYFSGFTRYKIRAFMYEVGRVIDETPAEGESRGLWWCEKRITEQKEHPREELRQCLDPTVEHEERTRLEEEGIPAETIDELLNARRAERVNKLSDLMKGLMGSPLIPAKYTLPDRELDIPYYDKLIKTQMEAIFRNVFDGLVSELEVFKILNLTRRPEDSVGGTPDIATPDELEGMDSTDYPFGDTEMLDDLRNSAGNGYPVNTPLLEVFEYATLSFNKLSGFRLKRNAPTNVQQPGWLSFNAQQRFKDVEIDYESNEATEETDIFISVLDRQGKTVSSTQIYNPINIDWMVEKTELLVDYTPTKKWKSDPETSTEGAAATGMTYIEYISDYVVRSNFTYLVADTPEVGMNGDYSDDQHTAYNRGTWNGLLEPISSELEEKLPLFGREAINDIFVAQVTKSGLFQSSNFKELKFVPGAPCEDVFDRIDFLSLEGIQERAMKDYERLLNADLGTFSTSQAVSGNALIVALVEIFLYEFLLCFVYFGNEVEPAFFSSKVFTKGVTHFLVNDILYELSKSTNKGVKDGKDTHDDFFNTVINIPWIEADRFGAQFRPEITAETNKKELVLFILEELVAQTVISGGIFKNFRRIYSDIDVQSEFDFDLDDLQGLIVSSLGHGYLSGPASHSTKVDITDTKSHFSAILDHSLLTGGLSAQDIFNALQKESLQVSKGSGLISELPLFSKTKAKTYRQSAAFSESGDFVLEPFIKATVKWSTQGTLFGIGQEIIFSYLDLPFLMNEEVALNWEDAFPGTGFAQLNINNLENFRVGIRMSYRGTQELIDIVKYTAEGDAAPGSSDPLVYAKSVLVPRLQATDYYRKTLLVQSMFDVDGDNLASFADNPEQEFRFPLAVKEKFVAQTAEEFKDLTTFDVAVLGEAQYNSPGYFIANGKQFNPPDVEMFQRLQMMAFVDTGLPQDGKELYLGHLLEEMLNSDEFNLICRTMFAGSELMTAYRLFLMLNNNDTRFAKFGKSKTPLGGTKRSIIESYSNTVYGASNLSMGQQAAEVDIMDSNTGAALRNIVEKTVPMMVKGILEKYDPGFITLKILKGIPDTEAEEDDNVLTYIPTGSPIPPLFFITTPLGLLYSALDEHFKTPKEEAQEAEGGCNPLNLRGVVYDHENATAKICDDASSLTPTVTIGQIAMMEEEGYEVIIDDTVCQHDVVSEEELFGPPVEGMTSPGEEVGTGGDILSLEGVVYDHLAKTAKACTNPDAPNGLSPNQVAALFEAGYDVLGNLDMCE